MSEIFAEDAALARRDYVFIPAGLLIAGTWICKRDWTIYAAIVAVLFGAYNLYALRKYFPPDSRVLSGLSSNHCTPQESYLFSSPTRSRSLSSQRRQSSPTM